MVRIKPQVQDIPTFFCLALSYDGADFAIGYSFIHGVRAFVKRYIIA
jgi:hypothetical protein